LKKGIVQVTIHSGWDLHTGIILIQMVTVAVLTFLLVHVFQLCLNINQAMAGVSLRAGHWAN